MRPRWSLVLLLVLACARRDLRGDDQPPALEVDTAPAPLRATDEQRLRAEISNSGALYWRRRAADGPYCEAWQLEPEPDDPTQGRLVHVDAAGSLSFRYLLADGLLRLHAPLRERERTAADGSVSVAGLAFPCIFSGASLTRPDLTAPRQLVLTSHERWFFDLDRCRAAGPDHDPQPPAPGELHPLGCASALADPATRARAEQGAPGPAAARLRASRRVFWLRRRRGVLRCEPWQHEPDAAVPRGQLRRSEPDQRGRRSIVYHYAITGASLTLLGPNESIKLRGAAWPAELATTRGCLLTLPLASAPDDALQVGDERWYLQRGACERARAAGVAAQADPHCGPAPRD